MERVVVVGVMLEEHRVAAHAYIVVVVVLGLHAEEQQRLSGSPWGSVPIPARLSLQAFDRCMHVCLDLQWARL